MRRRVVSALAAVIATASTGCQTGNGKPPQEQIDVVGIRAELLTIARAEQTYLTMFSKYGTLDELQMEHVLVDAPDRRGYTFSLTINGTDGFVVTASPADAGKTNWPTLTIDQSSQISEK